MAKTSASQTLNRIYVVSTSQMDVWTELTRPQLWRIPVIRRPDRSWEQLALPRDAYRVGYVLSKRVHAEGGAHSNHMERRDHAFAGEDSDDESRGVAPYEGCADQRGGIRRARRRLQLEWGRRVCRTFPIKANDQLKSPLLPRCFHSPVSPYFGHIVERAWPLMAHCYSPQIYYDCPKYWWADNANGGCVCSDVKG